VNGYRLILSNPTPSPREMTILAGRRLGISEGVVTTSQEVTIEIDSFTRLAIYYDAAGNPATACSTVAPSTTSTSSARSR